MTRRVLAFVAIALAAALALCGVLPESEASPPPCPPFPACTQATANDCLQKAINEISKGDANACGAIVVDEVPGACAAPAVDVTINGSKSTDQAKCSSAESSNSASLQIPIHRGDIKSAAAGSAIQLSVVALVGGASFTASAKVPAATEAGGPAPPGSSLAQSTDLDAGTKTEAGPAEEKTEAGSVMVPIDVAPRNCGIGTIPDIEWTPQGNRSWCDDRSSTGLQRGNMAYYTFDGSPNCNASPPTSIPDGAEACATPEHDRDKVFVVDEDLQVRSGPKVVTESDVIVVRFLVRRALACRVFATSDSSNTYDPAIIRVGGAPDGGLLAEASKLLKTEATGGPEKYYSCDEEIVPLSANQKDNVKQFTTKSLDYVTVDYRFGPFTSNQVVLHLYRHDRALLHNDMQSTLTIDNHLRYSGWFDVAFGANMLLEPERSVYAYRQNGDVANRLGTHDNLVEPDVSFLVRVYVTCGHGGLFGTQDVMSAPVCLGLGGGLSLLHPLQTFYPIGVNFTVNRFFSAHALLSLNKFDTLAPGYQAGSVYSGDTSNIPSQSRYVLGIGLSLGLDPSVFAVLVKGIFTGNK